MKPAAIILNVLLLVLVAASLTPNAVPFQFELLLIALVVAGLLLLLIARIANERTSPAPLPAAPPPATPPASASCDNQVVALISLLQERGRLVDFLMDDITAYGDAEVGAAARVVHQGCREVLKEHFSVVPIHEEAEGSEVTVPRGYAADEYRLVGTISGAPPFSGRLVHRGWRTTGVKMPRLASGSGNRLPSIAPAEVEL